MESTTSSQKHNGRIDTARTENLRYLSLLLGILAQLVTMTYIVWQGGILIGTLSERVTNNQKQISDLRLDFGMTNSKVERIDREQSRRKSIVDRIERSAERAQP